MKEERVMKIREAAEHLGVSVETLRRWDREGVIRIDRTPLGHRIFKPDSILQIQHIIKCRQRSSSSGERPWPNTSPLKRSQSIYDGARAPLGTWSCDARFLSENQWEGFSLIKMKLIGGWKNPRAFLLRNLLNMVDENFKMQQVYKNKNLCRWLIVLNGRPIPSRPAFPGIGGEDEARPMERV